MTAAPPDQARAAAEDLICCPPDLQIHALGEGQLVVHNRLSGGALVLDTHAHQTLSMCQEPSTLSQHAERLAQQGVAPRQHIEQLLNDWLQAGLLTDVRQALRLCGGGVGSGKVESDASALGAVGSGAVGAAGAAAPGAVGLGAAALGSATEPAAVRALCIPTVGRLQTLSRALRTLSIGAPPGTSCVIGDDSSHADERKQTRALLDSLRGELPLSVLVLDRPRRAAMAEQLATEAKIELRLARFALQPEPGPFASYGANRNALLLAHAGRRFVFADDDTFGPLKLPGASDERLHVGSDGALLHSDFPAPGETRFEGLRATASSLLGTHGRLLGRPVAELLSGDVEPQGVSARLLARLSAPGARVAVTQLGSLGDSGTGSLAHYLMLPGPSRRRLLQSEERYDWAQRSRLVRVFVEHPWLTDFDRLMGMACGIDAAQLLPPFPPLLRNADGVFGLILSRCVPAALFGWLPEMVRHQPPSTRSTSFDETLQEMCGIDANDALARLIAAALRSEQPNTPAANLRRLGDMLCGWAAAPQADFEARLRSIAIGTRANDLRQLRGALQQWDYEPGFWAQDVRRAIMTLEQAMIEPQHSWPRDMIAELGEHAGRAALYEHVALFGELLQVWPQLFEAARRLWPDATALNAAVG